MIVDALISAEPTLKIASQVYEPTRFLYLTDHVLTRIESSTEPVRRPYYDTRRRQRLMCM